MSITTNLPAFPCCPKPDINSMMKAPDVNAVCCNCGVHWWGYVFEHRFGVAERIKRFTKKEWDALMLEPMPA